jgi:hypothetical protein
MKKGDTPARQRGRRQQKAADDGSPPANLQGDIPVSNLVYGLDVDGLSCPILVASRCKEPEAVAAEVLAAQGCAAKGGPDAPDATAVVLYRHRWEGAEHTREEVARLTLGEVRPGKPAGSEDGGRPDDGGVQP